MIEDELRAELAGCLGCDLAELLEVAVEEPQGAAIATLADGRRYRFVGDGTCTSWELVSETPS